MKLSPGVWYPIVGYENLYFINSLGQIKNSKGHKLTPIESNYGYKIDLRKNGQRETYLIKDLLQLQEDYYETM